MLKNKVNPLDFLELRRLRYLPPSFESIQVPLKYNIESSYVKWIHEHLKGRFFVGKTIGTDEEDKIATLITVGFENHKELSYFTLACPYLKYK